MKRVGLAFLMMSMLLCSGCELTVGPRVEKKVVYARTTDKDGRPLKIGRVAQDAKVKIEVVTETGDIVEDEVNIGGWTVTPPEVGPAK